MKRLLIAIILLIAIPLLIYGSSSTTGVSFGAEVPGIVAAPTCSATPDLSQSSHYDYHWVGDTTSDSYSGFYFRDTVSRSICKVSFSLSKEGGLINTYTYTAQVWTTSGNNLSAVVTNGTSTGITGRNSWAHTLVTFTFPTPPSLTANTLYAIVVTCNTVNRSNFVDVDYYNAAPTSPIQGRLTIADSSGNATRDNTTTGVYQIYYYQ